MIKKRETCLYCGEKMESGTAKKKFCSPLHKLYWHREFKRGTLEPHQLEGMAKVTSAKIVKEDGKPTAKFNLKVSVDEKLISPPSEKKEPVKFKPLTLEERIAALEK